MRERTVPRMAALVVLVALGCGAAAAEPPVTSATPPATPVVTDDPWSSPDIVAPRMDSRPLPRETAAPGTPAGTVVATDRPKSWLRTTAALGGVVALIVILAWGYRAATGQAGAWRLARGGRHAGLMEVVGRTALSPRQSLCLVRVGPRLVLLGVTPDAVRSLDVIQDADLTARLLGQATQQRPDSSTAEFARCLEREADSYETEEHGADETLTPEAERIVSLRQRLAGAVERLRVSARGA